MIAERDRKRLPTVVLSVCCLVALTGSAIAAGGAEKLRFELNDAFGREVRSADYAGVPLFLEFGACW